MNPFKEFRNMCTGGRSAIDNPWFIRRLVSFQPKTFGIAVDLNYYGLTMDTIQACLNAERPQVGYVRYAKIAKSEGEVIDKICEHFCCNQYEAIEVVTLLRLQDIEPKEHFGIK